MARAEKKELTPVERMEQALVPEEEQPYPIPKNWHWCRMNRVYKINPPVSAPNNADAAFIPMEKVSAGMNWSFEYDVLPWEKAKKGHTQFSNGDVAFAKISPCFENRKSMVLEALPNGIGGGSTELVILRQAMMVPMYSFWLVVSDRFIKQGIQTYSGTVGQQRINMDFVRNFPVPVPPVSEQRRIVDRIESLFAKLDEAKEKAQAVVDGYEDRKAAILHKAFTGELTETWRRKKGIERSTWKRTTVKDACHDVKVGIVIKPSQYYTDKENGTPAFRSANVREFHVDNYDWVYLDERGMKGNQRSIVHTGDVLVVRSGNPGTACVVEEKYDGYNAIDILIAVPDKEKITPNYLCAFTNSPLGRKLISENKRGMALAHFNVNGFSALSLELPSIPEQEEIIQIMLNLLDSTEKSKRSAEQVISQIDTMKKAILARAFRGELGTNDPTEEPVDIGML